MPLNRRSLMIIPSSFLLWVSFAQAALLGSNPPAALQQQAGRTEFKGEMKMVGPGFGLTALESVNLPARYANLISSFYPYAGLAQLPGGRCIQFLREQPLNNGPPGQDLIGARIVRDPSLCARPTEGNPLEASPCNGTVDPSPVGRWRLTCKHLPRGRSALIAIGNSPATAGRKVKLAELDQDIRFFGTFAIHSAIAEVTTLGRRADGRTVLSKYSWVPPN